MTEKKPTKVKQCRMMNVQCDVEVVLIALLNQFARFTVAKPQRKTIVTKQFIKIVKIDFCSEDELEVQAFIRKREEELVGSLTKQGISQQTAKRRMQEAKRWELLHLLMDLIQEHGYIVFSENEQNCGFDGDVQILYQNKILFSKEEICKKANAIRDFIIDKVSHQTICIFEKNDLNQFL